MSATRIERRDAVAGAEKRQRLLLEGLISRRWLVLLWLLPVLGVLWTCQRAPVWLEPRALTVALEPGQTRVLGREALWAPQADSEHILLRRAADGGWWLSNLAPSKQVLWRPARKRADRPTREWPLTSGAAFTVGAQRFSIITAKRGTLVLQTGEQRWRYDGLRLQREGQPLPECYPGWRTQLRYGLAALGLRRLAQRPLRLGGGVYCADRLGLPGVAVDTAVVAPRGSGFVLRPGIAGRPEGPPVTVASDTVEAESLWRRATALAVGDRLIIGRTQYRVAQTAPDLKLAVAARAQRWPDGANLPATTHAVQVQWQSLAWLWPPDVQGLVWPLSLALALLVIGWVESVWRRGWRKACLWRRVTVPLACAAACVGLHLAVLSVPILWPYGLAWLALLVWLGVVRSPWSAGLLALVTLLLGGGLVTLLQLGVGAEESGWLRYGGSGAALAGAFGWLAWALRGLGQWQQTAGWLDARLMRWGLRGLGGVALALLAAQAGFGDEGGWGGLQPFELTKLALVAAAAYALLLRAQRWRRAENSSRPSLWLYSLGPVVLLLAVSGFALTFLHDFSPLLLLLVWTLALVWAYLRAHPRPARRWGGGAALIASILLMAGGAVLLHAQPERFPLDFQLDRLRVWAAPEQHPHSGYQLRRALEAIRAGGWWGSVGTDAANGRAMAIPAVENDFTPAFFLNRYGGMAAVALAGIQAAFILMLLTIANRALSQRACGADRLTALSGFAYFALYGGAALLGAHFLVSWGTNLGFLPVMGQPMPFLSAAGSHLLLFVLPIVALAVAAEEKSDDNPR